MVSVLLSPHVERVSVSHMGEFLVRFCLFVLQRENKCFAYGEFKGFLVAFRKQIQVAVICIL